MSKKIRIFWTPKNKSIQEPTPHHTVICLKCGYLYNRKTRKYSKKCPKCKTTYINTKKTEFYINTKIKKILVGKNMEMKRQ